jgi:hypothetical protein
MKNDMRAVVPDADFINLFESVGPQRTADILKINVRKVYSRRSNLEAVYRRQIKSPATPTSTRRADDHAPVIQHRIKDGIVLIGSDAHIWPGEISTALRAFIKFCKDYKPQIVIMNGDVLDFPQISRHPPIGHQSLPNIKDEIETAQEVLHKIELAVSRSCKLVWTLGNHDARFETRLAVTAPEYAKLNGHSLKNYFPAWSACWRCDINDSVEVRHRPKGSGINANHNSTLWSGKTCVSGHLHSQRVSPITDRNGTRWGVDSGCLAEPNAEAFIDYTEAGPLNWRSGFAVLTFVGGRLLPPELVTVWDKKSVIFRGDVIKV